MDEQVTELTASLTPEMRRSLAETGAFIIETRRQRLALLAAEQDAPAGDEPERATEDDDRQVPR